MRSLTVIAILVSAVCGFWVAPVLADDGSETTSFTGVGPGVTQQVDHVDADPWKGYFTVTATNYSDGNWYDFHFGIKDIGWDPSNVDIIVASPYEPTSSQSGLTWSVDNSDPEATIDLYFYSDPVLQNETATFTIYTDNTVSKKNFGVCFWPTIPEPGTMSLLALAGLALLRRRG